MPTSFWNCCPARDRDGLPESIRFWKLRIEEMDLDKTFRVGLIYGPSGCGKSSLMKAGLLPRLASHVVTVYLEAAPEDTELRLLKGLRRRFPTIPEELALPDVLAGIREGQWVPEKTKVCVVLDQFEQWLHARRAEQDTQLVQALRHCDGGRLQAVVLVRDDFWLAASRFMQDLEVDLVQGVNMVLVDLFDPLHARSVLAAFGRAYRRLPDEATALSQDQETFLDRAVAGLAQDGKIICVRLALFADMLKGNPWTTATLSQVGGTEGLGVTFLEETFSSSTAPAAHRHHQKAAQAVLKALLPEAGSDIKGSRQSYATLLDASGYAQRPGQSSELIRILDGEIRLITPTVPEGENVGTSPDQPEEAKGKEKYYQLTHDYLVPSLRDWLTRKQKETRRGRAELRLAERSALWNAKPENQQLPSWWEDLGIRSLTDRRKWNEPQRKMMRRAGWVHGSRSLLTAILLLMFAWAGFEVYGRVQARNLLTADPATLPSAIARLSPWQMWASRYLRSIAYQESVSDEQRREQLHARLATVSRDPSLVEPLVEQLLTGKVTYVLPIRQQLRPAAAQLTDKLRSLLRDAKADPQRRFRAALALADYLPESEATAWSQQDLQFMAEQLASSNAEHQPLLREALRPIRARLLEDVERIFGDATATDAQRLSAANALEDYARDDIARLTRLLTFATPEQYAVLYPLVETNPTPSTVTDLAQIAATPPTQEMSSVDRIACGQQRANAAVTLLRLGEPDKAIPVFEVTDDPEAMTQFIFRCRPREIGVESLLDCLAKVSDAPQDRYPKNARYALLLALGEFQLDEIPESRRTALVQQLAQWYRHDPSSGVHGAAGWLLRHWGQTDIARGGSDRGAVFHGLRVVYAGHHGHSNHAATPPAGTLRAEHRSGIRVNRVISRRIKPKRRHR